MMRLRFDLPPAAVQETLLPLAIVGATLGGIGALQWGIDRSDVLAWFVCNGAVSGVVVGCLVRSGQRFLLRAAAWTLTIGLLDAFIVFVVLLRLDSHFRQVAAWFFGACGLVDSLAIMPAAVLIMLSAHRRRRETSWIARVASINRWRLVAFTLLCAGAIFELSCPMPRGLAEPAPRRAFLDTLLVAGAGGTAFVGAFDIIAIVAVQRVARLSLKMRPRPIGSPRLASGDPRLIDLGIGEQERESVDGDHATYRHVAQARLVVRGSPKLVRNLLFGVLIVDAVPFLLGLTLVLRRLDGNHSQWMR